MSFDFPNAPTTNQNVSMPDGSVRRWDGVKWVAGQTPTSPYCFVGDTPPANPTPGVSWWDSVSCQLFVYYNDGNSSQWVPAVAIPASVGEAPANSNIYGRQNGQWVNTGNSQLQGNVGRNFLQNPFFTVQQRGVGPWTTNGTYTADRWAVFTTGADTFSASIQALTDAQRTQIGDEAARNALGVTINTTGGSTQLYQRIEGVTRLTGKTVTISFWASASITSFKVGVGFVLNFASGNSTTTSVQLVTLSATSNTFARYSLTFALDSSVGKTFDTTSNAQLNLWLSGNAAGSQTGSITIWGTQLEIGTVATQLERYDVQQEIAKCQRYYQAGSFDFAGYHGAGGYWCATMPFKVAMRSGTGLVFTPTFTAQANCSGSSVIVYGAEAFRVQTTVTTTSGFSLGGNWTASSEL